MFCYNRDMADSTCPKCRRKMWSAKWKTCFGCGFKGGDVEVRQGSAAPLVELAKKPSRHAQVTPVTPEGGSGVTSVTLDAEDVTPVTCSECGRPYPKDGRAGYMRAWRAKRKEAKADGDS